MAKSPIKGLIVEIGGDTSKLGEALETVDKQTKNLSTELKGINTLLKMNPSSITLLAQKQKVLTEAVANTEKKLKTLKSAQAQVNEKFKEGKISVEQYRSFQREIVSTKTKLKDLKSQLRDFGSVAAQEIALAGEKMKDFGGKVEETGKKLGGLSAGAAAALTGVSKTAIDFESAWAGVTKTVDESEEDMALLQQGILDLAQSTASSATDIAAVMENAGQLGVTGRENLMAFTETMIRLGDSTNISATDASSAIAKLYNIMGGSLETVDQFGSALVALGNNFATTEDDIMQMATRLASAGNQLGMTEQEVLAVATTLSSVGLEAEAGGSAISQVLITIDKAVGTNSEELKLWAEVAGMSVSQFKTMWEQDAMGAIQAVIGGLGDAKAGGENLNVVLDDLGITTIRQTDTMRRLTSASDLMTDAVNLSNQAWDENNALTVESDKRYETTAAKMQQLKGAITELCVKLGETLLPIIQKVVEKVTEWVNWFTNLDPTIQKVILAVTAFVAALGPTLITVGKLITAFGNIMTYAPQIATAIKGIGTVFSTLSSLVVKGIGMLKPLITGLFTLITAHPIIAVITAVIAAVVLLWNKCEWFRDGVKKIWEAIKTAFNATVEWFRTTLQKLGKFFSDAWEAIKKVWNNSIIGKYFNQIWNSIKGIFSAVKSVLSGNFKEAWTAIKGVFSGWKTFFTNLKDQIFSAFANIGTKMKEIGGNIVRGIWNGISNLASWLWDKLTGWATGIVDWVKDKFGIKSPSRVFAGIGKFLDEGLAQGIEDNMSDPINAVRDMSDGILDEANGLSLESNIRNRSMQMAAEVTAKADNTMLGKLDKILTAIERGQIITLDSKQLVGGTAAAYDNVLGQRRVLAARGAV